MTEPENPPLAELFWAGYLNHEIEVGNVTGSTPHEEVARMKASFMAGLRGEEES